MSSRPGPTRKELQRRLAEAEALIAALRGHEVDAIVGDRQIAFVRLQEVEEALAKASRQLREILESITDAFAAVDDSWRLSYINAAAARCGGKRPEELAGRSLWESLPQLAGTALEGELRRAMAERVSVRGEFDTLMKDRWHAVTISPSAEGLSIYCQDITDRRRTELELQRLNEELERRVEERTAVAERRAAELQGMAAQLTRAEQRERRRLARVLHDHLQQLLVAVRMRLAGLKDGLGDRRMADEVVKVDELLEQALEASRTLTVDLSPPVLHHGGLVPGLHWLAVEMKQRHGLQVEVKADENAEPDGEELRIFLFGAVRELLFNVVKHAGVASAALRASCEGEARIRIEVSDQGVGFDPGGVDPLGGAQEAWGLFNIRERLELLGGHLEVEAAPGRGARFALLAPRSSAPIRAAAALGPAGAVAPGAPVAPACELAAEVGPRGNRKIRVLVVDDHRLLREGVMGLLQRSPDMEAVGEAQDGETAVAAALELRPDVVVMDIVMPGVDGIEATRRIVSALPGTRVVGLSMHEEQDMVRRMIEAGASAYLAKGGASEDLLGAIRRLFEEDARAGG
jgi:PAS domain S-box-containing protein